MARPLLLAALLIAAPAVAQDTVLVTQTSDGIRLDAPTDAPVGDAPTALLAHTTGGGWALRVLRPGDVPTQLSNRASARPPAPPRPPARLSGEAVAYRVRAHVGPRALDALLVRLSDAEPLASLESSTDGDRAHVEATFRFGSVAEWAAWHDRPETQRLLVPLLDAENAETQLRARRSS